MKLGIRQLARSSAVAWSVAFLAIAFAIGVTALAWHFRKATVDEVLVQVSALDPQSYKKICAHRSNNILMYRQALKNFNCIEIDIHVSPAAGGSAAVYHPPDSNNLGLTLDFLLTQEPLPPGRLWLDTKDLSKENWSGYLEQLNRLIPTARHRDVVVETVWADADVQAAAAAFRQSGIAFSYYLPTDAANACGARQTLDCDTLRRQVTENVSRGFSHLSFDYRGYEFAKSIRSKLPPGVKFLTWDLSKSWPKRDLLDDVDIYIINFPSVFRN